MRVLSGVQPSGKLHIGNYFGMMKPAIELQEQGEAFLFIANYHALTSVHEGAALREMTRMWRWIFWRVGLIRNGRLFIDRVMCQRCMSWRGCFRY